MAEIYRLILDMVFQLPQEVALCCSLTRIGALPQHNAGDAHGKCSVALTGKSAGKSAVEALRDHKQKLM